jgi:hypothetical protein
MMDDFSKYEQLRAGGSSPQEIYRAAREDGLDSITVLRLLRKVCQFSLVEAKEVAVVADGLGNSLSDYQEQLLPGVENAVAPRQDGGSRTEPAAGGEEQGELSGVEEE